MKSIIYMDSLQFYKLEKGWTKLGDRAGMRGGSFGESVANLQIPLGLFYDQLSAESTLGLDDIMKATVADDSFFKSSSSHTTRKNKLQFKTTKKHK